MPQRPGALKEFLAMLGPDDDIARFEYLKKSARNFGSVLIGIETKRAENFTRLFRDMDEAGFTYRDITNDDIAPTLTLVKTVINEANLSCLACQSNINAANKNKQDINTMDCHNPIHTSITKLATSAPNAAANVFTAVKFPTTRAAVPD